MRTYLELLDAEMLMEIVNEQDIEIADLTMQLEAVKLELEQLKKKDNDSQTGYRYRDKSFAHDHLASSNS